MCNCPAESKTTLFTGSLPPQALKLFLSPLPPSCLSIISKGYDGDVPFRVEHSSVSDSLYLYLLWVSLSIATYSRKKLLQ